MNRYQLVLISSFAIFVFFLTPNVNSGDGGELTTAAWFLGTAHPSGYPLYSLIARTLDFLPLGNIAFRTAVVSALFSSLSLTLIYWIVFSLTASRMASLFSVTALLVSYSYFTQSVIAKFYMLNLFLILLLFSLWATRLTDVKPQEPGVGLQSGDSRLLYLTMLVAGLITANHHTGVIIFCPLAVAWFLDPRRLTLDARSAIAGIVFFFSGFFINIYLVIRGTSDHFFNAENIDNFVNFYNVITRQAYGNAGTISSAHLFFHGFSAYWYALKNFVSVLTTNFSYFSYVLFFAGSIYLIRKKLKLFVFLILSLTLYGPALAKLTLVLEKKVEVDYYITANQYFIPAIAFFVVMLAIGFYQFEEVIRARGLKLLSKTLPIILAVFPLVFLVSRTADSNYRTDFVPYQLARDTYSVLPSDSVIMTFGDNTSYQGWYLKLVGRYREDVCQIAADDQAKIRGMFQGCSKKVYGRIFPMFYSGNFKEMMPVLMKYRHYGTDPIRETGEYRKFFYSEPLSVDYLYLPQKKFVRNQKGREKDLKLFLSQRQLSSDGLVNSSVCLSHFTDDFFSRELCSDYVVHLTNTARLYSDAIYERTGEKVILQATDIKSGYDQSLYTIYVTKKNRPYLELASHILGFNKWPILYIREN